MSWDIFVLDLPAEAETIEDIPADFAPRPLGPRSDIIAAICTIVPYADFTDPAWGHIDASEFSIEVNLGDDELVDSFALHVRGGDEAVTCIAAMLDALGVRAVDASSGDFFNREAAVESFGRWRSYRDHVVETEG